MNFRCLIIIIITALILLPLQSYALSPIIDSFRHLYEETHGSPSPSPSYGVNLASRGSNLQQTCSRASKGCQLKNITACLFHSQNETRLFIHNNGEKTQDVKIVILPAKNTNKEINIRSHQIEKEVRFTSTPEVLNWVVISSDVDLSFAIVLTTDDGDCVISTATAPPPEYRNHKISSYGTYITLINGAYLVILILIIGGILTYFKLTTRSRHLEGVAYHELEMGNLKYLEDNETENWDQDWNDEWGDEKPVKSGGDNHVLVKQANDHVTKLPNSNGRKKEWDD